MSNCAETKKQMDTIRSKYNCAGDVIFRTAIQMIVEHGQSTFKDDAWYEDQLNAIDDRHDAAESVGKFLFMTRDFEKAIMNCAKDLANIEPYDFLMYIQTEVFLGGNSMDYQHMMRLLKKCIEWIEETHACLGEAYDTLRYVGFSDSDIEMLGFDYILDVVYPEEEDE